MKFIEKASLRNLHIMLKFVLDQSRLFGVDRGLEAKIELAVEEALVNIIHYAYGEDGGSIEIECQQENSGFFVKITDKGKQFNPLSSEVSLDDQGVGGQGLPMMRKLVDRMEYKRKDDCNILMLVWG